jgi:hypothetical protein
VRSARDDRDFVLEVHGLSSSFKFKTAAGSCLLYTGGKPKQPREGMFR